MEKTLEVMVRKFFLLYVSLLNKSYVYDYEVDLDNR